MSDERISYQAKPGVDRIGYWDVGLDGDAGITTRLDIEPYRIEMQKRMAEMEDSMLAGIVADEMRRRGYTVIPPA
ncbi:hypothetical protein [Plantibacter sp. M259]|uniref:hypothetical protein n=1 Tax=Plantibacter sp. M259 TaxID=2583822 RepID=UPI0011107176|nr:hypothetical protein [Plantibacter sp. M259]